MQEDADKSKIHNFVRVIKIFCCFALVYRRSRECMSSISVWEQRNRNKRRVTAKRGEDIKWMSCEMWKRAKNISCFFPASSFSLSSLTVSLICLCNAVKINWSRKRLRVSECYSVSWIRWNLFVNQLHKKRTVPLIQLFGKNLGRILNFSLEFM